MQSRAGPRSGSSRAGDDEDTPRPLVERAIEVAKGCKRQEIEPADVQKELELKREEVPDRMRLLDVLDRAAGVDVERVPHVAEVARCIERGGRGSARNAAARRHLLRAPLWTLCEDCRAVPGVE